MGKPSKGTPKDKRLKANKPSSGGSGSARSGSGGGSAFGGNKAKPFAKGGGRKK